MKRTVFLAAALAAIAVGATQAADLYGGGPYAAQVAIPIKNWAGPYVGANIGYQLGRTSIFNIEPNGIVGGVQGGYLWQFGQFVVGGEVDFELSGAEETFAAYKFSNPWFGTARARLGYAMNNILFYGTGGVAFGKGELEYFATTERHTHGGLAVGAGLEVGLGANWSARAEYLYVSLSDTTYALTNMNTGIESSIVRFGLNYRF